MLVWVKEITQKIDCIALKIERVENYLKKKKIKQEIRRA